MMTLSKWFGGISLKLSQNRLFYSYTMINFYEIGICTNQCLVQISTICHTDCWLLKVSRTPLILVYVTRELFQFKIGLKTGHVSITEYPILSFIFCAIYGAKCFQHTHFLLMIMGIFVLHLIILIKLEVRIISPCLGLRHETMVCAVCLAMFLGIKDGDICETILS